MFRSPCLRYFLFETNLAEAQQMNGLVGDLEYVCPLACTMPGNLSSNNYGRSLSHRGKITTATNIRSGPDVLQVIIPKNTPLFYLEVTLSHGSHLALQQGRPVAERFGHSRVLWTQHLLAYDM